MRRFCLKPFPKSGFRANSGLKCPNNIPQIMAVSTQNVRLVKSFFIVKKTRDSRF
jgi:hypothetical protein